MAAVLRNVSHGSFGLKKALEFFCESSFLWIKETSSSGPRAFLFGANGGLLLQNFIKEWMNVTMLSSDRVSLVSPSLYHAKSDTASLYIPRHSLQDGCKSFYHGTLSLHKNRLPIGIASYGSCLDLNTTTKGNQIDRFPLGIEKPAEYTECLLQYYLTEEMLSDKLHRLEVERLMWWKKLLNSEELRSIRPQNDNHTCRIVYSSPHGDVIIEELTVSGPLTELELSPMLIESRIIADIAAVVILFDAYVESVTNDGEQRALRLHQRLAPYKLGIMVEDSNEDDYNVVTEYIKEELRKEAILIKSNHSSDFQNLKENGVPYAVLLTAETLKSGVSYLHNLNASTKETVHLTLLKDKIVQYVTSQ